MSDEPPRRPRGVRAGKVAQRQKRARQQQQPQAWRQGWQGWSTTPYGQQGHRWEREEEEEEWEEEEARDYEQEERKSRGSSSLDRSFERDIEAAIAESKRVRELEEQVQRLTELVQSRSGASSSTDIPPSATAASGASTGGVYAAGEGLPPYPRIDEELTEVEVSAASENGSQA